MSRPGAPLRVPGVLLRVGSAVVLAFAGALGVGLAGSLTGTGAAAQAGVPPERAGAAPGLEWRLETLAGREVSLGELAGRPLVVNVWATWCLPCVAELRSLERLARSLEGDDIGFAVVAAQDRGVVAEWVRRRRYALPFYVEATRMPAAFGLEAVPTTWVLDRDGRVVLKHRGAADWDRDDVRALLRTLAAGPSRRD